jgi:chromosome condensin MukBEF ATPase and DNA-binding subunit MukB
MLALLREMLTAHDRQNELLEELVGHLSSAQRQRMTELGQWKQANPRLARSCRLAAEALSKVQTEYLENLTEEVTANYESLRDGEFMLNEFVDRFGPRLAHLNGLMQVLSQLSSTPNPANSP